MSEDIETLMQRIETLQQERDAAQKARAEMRQLLSDAIPEPREWLSTESYRDFKARYQNALSSDCGKGWHSPEEWDALERAITEMRQRIANCHDRLVRGDSDTELLDFFRGSWCPPTGKGFWSDEQVSPVLDALRKCRCSIQGYKDTHPLAEGAVLNQALITAKQALAHARAVGMEKS